MNKTLTLLAFPAVALLASCAMEPTVVAEPAPVTAPCPEGIPADAKCWRGVDSKGSHYLLALPAQWNQVLVVHAHGGPPLTARASRSDEDAKRWGITVKAGYAWAASVYHQGGVAVTSAAEDTERVRQIFVQHVAKPRRTILHGQSWGAAVAARAAEMYATSAQGRSPYDGVLLTSGVLGGRHSYDFRLDLRVVYQALCHNHPLPSEPQYPLWMGLPPDSKLTERDLAARIDECLAVRKPAAQRTPEQARKVKAIVDVVHIPATSIPAHLSWATWHFQDIVQHRTGGRNPFPNDQVRYQGSPDDAALNAAVERYKPDAEGIATFSRDIQYQGKVPVPVITAHAIGDPTAMVEFESAYREAMNAGGSGDRLVQVFTEHKEHSYLADPIYPTLFETLLAWIDRGAKPTPQSIAARCKEMEATWGEGCRMRPDYVSPPLATRTAPR